MPRLAVLGRPVAHSRSPAMQNAALAELGLAGEWSYEAIEVAAQEFEPLVRSLPGRDFAGVNVTVPHKLAALAVADRASAAAREIGASNTLSFTAAGIEADNTDASGLIAALPESPRGRRALVLGAGGSARAAVWALKRAGAVVEIWNRTPEKAQRLAAKLGVAVESTGSRSDGAGGRYVVDGAGFDLLVNCTTVGLASASESTDLEPLPLDADSVRDTHTVVDLAYGPSPTPLIAAATSRGARVVDGLDVLVHQGAASLRIWTGRNPPLETMRRAAREGRTSA